AQNFTINAGSGGGVTFGTLGGVMPLASLSVTAGSIIHQKSNVKTTGPVTYAGSNAIGGNITTAGGIVTLNNLAQLIENCLIDTTNGGETAGGANIVLNNV